jgi:hypothetical protein
MKNVVPFIFVLLAMTLLPKEQIAQSTNKNFISVRIPSCSTYLSTDIDILGFDKKVVQTKYLDGFNRVTQCVTQQATDNWNGKDLVQFFHYDLQDRQPKIYLPYVATSSNGEFQQDPVRGQLDFFSTASKVSHDGPFYSENKFDNSPLNQVVESSAPGASWEMGNGHTISQSLSFNEANEIFQWKVNFDPQGRPIGATQVASYPENTLFKQSIVDEHGNISYEYKDNSGHIICKQIKAYTDVDNMTSEYAFICLQII